MQRRQWSSSDVIPKPTAGLALPTLEMLRCFRWAIYFTDSLKTFNQECWFFSSGFDTFWMCDVHSVSMRDFLISCFCLSFDVVLCMSMSMSSSFLFLRFSACSSHCGHLPTERIRRNGGHVLLLHFHTRSNVVISLSTGHLNIQLTWMCQKQI